MHITASSGPNLAVLRNSSNIMLRKFTAFAFALAFLTLSVGGSPSSFPQPGKISVRSLPRPNGIAEYHKALRKYDLKREKLMQISPRRPNSFRRRQSSNPIEMATLDPAGANYCSPITVGEGENAQTFNVQFDTGIGDFWLFSNLLNTGQLQGNITHNVYDPLNSSTAVSTEQSFSIRYTTGNITGVVFNDTVTVAGIQVKNQNIMLPVSTFSDFDPQNFYCDGVFGLWDLGPTDIQPLGNHPPVLQALLFGDSSPKEKIFTVFLTRPGEPPGFYTFGTVEQSVVGNNTITFVDSDPSWRPFWVVPVSEFFVNDKAIPYPHSASGIALVDSGTSMVLAPDNFLQEIYPPLGGFFDNTTQLWLFPANVSEADLPKITLPAGGLNVTLAATDLVFDTHSVPGFVIGGIQSSGDLSAIYGDVWLRNVYAVFQLGLTRKSISKIGLVPRVVEAGNVDLP